MMRNSPLLVLVGLLLPLNLSAQISSVKEDPPQFDESRKIWLEVVENQDSRSIVAVHASFHCPTSIPIKGSGKHVTETGTSGEYDGLLNAIYYGFKGIAPGAAATIVAADPANCSGGVDAVLFWNGQIEGQARWLDDFYPRWRGVYQGVNVVLPLLTKVANQQTDLADVEDILRHRMEPLGENVLVIDVPLSATEYAEKAVYLQLDSMLRSSGQVKEASDSTSHTQLSSDEIEVNGIPRKQRKMILFLIGRLKEWNTALERVLQPSAAQ